VDRFETKDFERVSSLFEEKSGRRRRFNIFFTRTRASTKTRLLLLEEEEEEDNKGVVVVPRLLARGMRSIDSMEVVVVYARACFSLYSVTLVF
tara:strand:+ start:219 stop:497 length:279 start_codon:yes stop_codon:yes gene_type:complete